MALQGSDRRDPGAAQSAFALSDDLPCRRRAGTHNGRAARPSEIAQRLGVDVEVVIEGLAAQGAGRPRSLDEPDLSGNGSSDRARFGSALGLHEAEFDLVEHRQTLAPLLAALPERERRILLLRFFDGLTQTQIAAKMGISQMHVSRLLARTLSRLREKSHHQ